jgi:hypothetical protein
MLNQYFKEMYDGKLLVRFDDTNPSKARPQHDDHDEVACSAAAMATCPLASKLQELQCPALA